MILVFDGFGVNPSTAYNGWALANTPHLDHYFASNPHTTLQASGLAVGLPDGQFGNSEVGHLTIGAGRIIEQDLVRITNAINSGEIQENLAWQNLMQQTKRLHLVGLVSDGGVHSHIDHLIALLPILKEAGVEPVIHMITDGRDTSPRSALTYLDQLEQAFANYGVGTIATVSGRYHTMDRAGNWDRTETAWQCIVMGKGFEAENAREAITKAYERGETDEFIQPTVIGHPKDILVNDDELLLLFNFRSDRVRQLSAALAMDKFEQFGRKPAGSRKIVTMTEYSEDFPFPVMFPTIKPEKVLSEVVAEHGLKQFHCAEKEKYPHVTYFFNGGEEQAYPGEERVIIDSPNVATYDLQPEMSTPEVADRVIAAIQSGEYSFFMVNFANGDMVGHTAIQPAIIEAVECLDLQSHRVIQAALANGVRVLLTADHGNCDEMVDPITGEPHTQHTEYPVPFLVLGQNDVQLGTGRGLADIAPTVLDLLGLDQPEQMTASSIIINS
ncbi:MAG: 2,3-bisphosphoglycerate-independent phosphoglycerate mutase [Gammaproteobacteria bacterium]|nr:2,3-bisphosphoglycerate-independent phosphoglycerate mutase [Gammaproteobacteria bacterium]